jgi:actin-binding protein IPP
MRSDETCAADDPAQSTDAEAPNSSNATSAGNNLRKCPPKHFTRFTHGLYSAGVLRNLSDMRRRGEFCDVKLVVEGQEFSAHRAVLAASSAYFRAMFAGGMKEAEMEDVTIGGVPVRCFEGLLDFIYSGEVQVDQFNVQELMQVGSKNACFSWSLRS